MKSLVVASAVWLGLAGVAFAQGSGEPTYSIGVAGASAFGNVTSQAFGAEAGINLSSSLGIFIEGGRVVDAAPASLGTSAEIVAAHIGLTAANVGYTVKQPVDFFAAGLRYWIDIHSKLAPYILAGAGIGMVKPDAEFTVGGTNVNSNLGQYGVALGSDLSGTTTQLMLDAGAGARYPLGDHFYADLEFRYNRVFISGRNIPFSRVGLGLGVRF